MPINTEVKEFADTMTSVLQSTAEQKGTSNFWRNQEIEALAEGIQKRAYSIKNKDFGNVRLKDEALKIAIAAMHIWQKL